MNKGRLHGIEERCIWRGKCNKDAWSYGFITDILYYENIACIDNQISVNADTLGQYTGQKDKNGNEVYEGDIVKFNYKYEMHTMYGAIPDCDCECKGVVMYDDDLKCIGVSVLESEEPIQLKKDDFLFFCFNDILEDMEVIGNIYDSPELLNK